VNRRTFGAAVVAKGAAAMLGASRAAGSPGQPPPPLARNVVLLHGAYADGSCWSDVIPHLASRGLAVAAVQNPLPSFEEDAQDVDPQRAEGLYATQGRISQDLFNASTSEATWRSKPSFYAVSARDRTIDPNLERFMAKRMNATTIELDSGHLSLVSHPKSVADLILQAAGA
jgi:pimeloyl-ACP methyl ester carboxylesterase